MCQVASSVAVVYSRSCVRLFATPWNAAHLRSPPYKSSVMTKMWGSGINNSGSILPLQSSYDKTVIPILYMRKMKHEGLVREPVIKELDTDMTLNLNIFPYTVLVPKSLQTPRQDGVSAPKNSNCVRWTSLFILFPCACFKASWCHRIASGVSVAQSLSCFHWDGLSDAPERALSMITWPNAHQQHQHRV